MKTRILSGLVGAALLLAVLFCPWTWVFTLVVAAAAAIAVYELLHNTTIVKSKWLLFGSMAFAVLTVVTCGMAQEHVATILTEMGYAAPTDLYVLLVGLLAVYAAFSALLFAIYRKAYVWKGFGLTLYATAGFAALAALRNSPLFFGLAYVLLPMVIAWMSDTGAYFTGVFFGKHKMAPVISPKKTWEGFFGGWAISIGLTAVYGVICNALIDPLSSLRVDVGLFAVLAAVLAPLSVCGDLLASVIKRRCGIKDYGNIMPGHGGVMDRFDSVVLIAPLTYIALAVFG